MILKGVDATRYLARPDPGRAGLLIFGADAMRVALKRQEAIAALIGPDGEAEMRLTRLPAAELRKDATRLGDALREKGFFPGPRVVFLEDATDALSPLVEAALQDWRPGDAALVVTAGALTGKSTLKTLFDRRPEAVSIGLYDDPPTREEIEEALRKAGLTRIDPAATADLSALARALDPGDFRQTLDRLALYKWGDTDPLSSAEVALLAPATIEAEVDDLVNAAAERNTAALGPLLRRLEGQGVQAVTICIGALRHFRALHVALCDPGGVAAGLARARVFGPRRDAMQRQTGQWTPRTLEAAMALLLECDLTLRSSMRAPAMAVIERALIRVAMMKGR
jgi:DNA polymerase-3 subunit delta